MKLSPDLGKVVTVPGVMVGPFFILVIYTERDCGNPLFGEKFIKEMISILEVTPR